MSRRQAKTHSFVRSLLEGRLDLEPITPYPSLSHGRVRQIEDLLREIRQDSTPRPASESLRAWELLQRPIEWPTPLLSRVIRQVGATDTSSALSATAHLALGARLVRAWGSEAQSRALLDSKPVFCAFALTEEAPGSDISHIQTYAEPTDDGFVISGTKHWVTNATSATHFVVVARTAPPRAADKPKLTTFFIRNGPGIEITPVPSEVLPGAGVGRVQFNRVHVKHSDVLGSVGKGFRVVMSGLSEARLLVASAVLGACIRVYNDTIARLNARRAFGRPVARFPSVQGRIAGMLAEIVAMESLVHACAGVSDIGQPVDPVERAVVRLAVSRGAARVFSAARELHGAAAFAGTASASRHWANAQALTLLDGSDMALESYILLEGTRELRHRLATFAHAPDMIARVDAGASLLLDRAKERIRKATAQEVPHVDYRELGEKVSHLGHCVRQAVEKHGADLVEKQHVHSRLASATSELATWTALCARLKTEIETSGEVGAHRMSAVAEIWTRSAGSRLRSLFEDMESNDDVQKDGVANLAYSDESYPFDVF